MIFTYLNGIFCLFSDGCNRVLLADNVGPSDVGLTQNMPYFQNSSSAGTLSVTYLHIYECHKFSVLEDPISVNL